MINILPKVANCLTRQWQPRTRCSQESRWLFSWVTTLTPLMYPIIMIQLRQPLRHEGRSPQTVFIWNSKNATSKSKPFPRNKTQNKFKERSPPAGVIGQHDIFQNEIKADRPFLHSTYLINKRSANISK